MSETLKQILSSQHPWSAVFYLVAGVIIGALVGFYLTVRYQRPRLIISGHGGGSKYDAGKPISKAASLIIMNRPSFFGILFNGETAHDVRVHVVPKQPNRRAYL